MISGRTRGSGGTFEQPPAPPIPLMTVEPTRSQRQFIGMRDGMHRKKRAERRVIA